MIDALQRLIRLQQLDSAADEARRRIAEQPARLAALDAMLASAQEAVAGAKARQADNQAARRAIEKDVAAIQTRLSKYKDQLMEVKTNREYQAMQKEIEVAQLEIKTMEDQILERMVEADEIAAALKSAEKGLVTAQADVQKARRTLEEELAQVDATLQSSVAARADVAAGVEATALAHYEQLFKQRKGVAVAEAREGICTVCQMRLRPQMYNELKRNDAIVHCESCQRILYFVPPAAGPASSIAAPAAPAPQA